MCVFASQGYTDCKAYELRSCHSLLFSTKSQGCKNSRDGNRFCSHAELSVRIVLHLIQVRRMLLGSPGLFPHLQNRDSSIFSWILRGEDKTMNVIPCRSSINISLFSPLRILLLHLNNTLFRCTAKIYYR